MSFRLERLETNGGEFKDVWLPEPGSLNLIIGTQAGDEGKGRVTDLLASQSDFTARAFGGNNAGHTLEEGLATHQVPSGIIHEGKRNVMGPGMLINFMALDEEAEELRSKGYEVNPDNLFISDSAHLVLPHHIMADELRESNGNGQGSTKRGIAFAAAEKYQRSGIRADILLSKSKEEIFQTVYSKIQEFNKDHVLIAPESFNEEMMKIAEEWTRSALKFKDYLKDTSAILDEALEHNQTVLGEGAQAIGLDIHEGQYPLVTSTHTGEAGFLAGLGLPSDFVDEKIGVAKLIKSRVGGDGSDFPTQITDPELSARVRGKRGDIDAEYGASTGRERMVGYLCLPEIRRAHRANRLTGLGVTKGDCLTRLGRTTLIAASYDYRGERQLYAANSAAKTAEFTPNYEEFPLWSEDVDVRSVRKRQDLPNEFQAILNFIEEQTDVPIRFIGVGHRKDEYILC